MISAAHTLCGVHASGGLEFRRLEPLDLFDLEPQPSQRTWLGVETAELATEDAEMHAAGANSWTAWADGKPLACLGVLETFANRQGLAWALLGVGLGKRHLALTRFARDVVIGQSPLARIDTYAPCKLAPWPTSSQLELVSFALQHPTAEVRWALAVGFMPLAVLRRFGAAGETFLQLERIR